MDLFPHYKPVRNYLRGFPRTESLFVIRAYLQHLQFGMQMPRDIEFPARFAKAKSQNKGFYEWELELLAKEIILNAGTTGPRTLRRWSEFAEAVNRFKDLENAVSAKAIDRDNVLMEMSRLAHRQFPWQRRPNSATAARYFRLFSDHRLAEAFRRKVGVSTLDLYKTGLLAIGAFLRSAYIDLEARPELPGLSQEALRSVFDHFSLPMEQLREEVEQAQRYDENFFYAFNPLRRWPLIREVWGGRNIFLSPAPTLLFNRFTAGVYYDVMGDADFSDAFGKAFERYVGDVLGVVRDRSAAPVELYREAPYDDGQKHSIDWIVRDGTADLFIECKTKRMTVGSKAALSLDGALQADLDKMAGFITQAYRTLADGLAGRYPHWTPIDGRPIYPLIVTLEAWYLFAFQYRPILMEKVQAGLEAAKLEADLMVRHPFTLCTVEELEQAVQVMVARGIRDVMSRKTDPETEKWYLQEFISRHYRSDLSSIALNLFPDDFDRFSKLP